MTDSIENMLRIISWKTDELKVKGLQVKGILVPPDDYAMLQETVKKLSGSNAPPDRLKGLPLYTPDPEKISGRTGAPKEPMVMF